MNIQKRLPPEYMQQRKPAQQGVVILEALIAILLFSMGVLALVGLQASMIKNTDTAKFRAEASFIAQQRIGEMWSDPDNTASYIESFTDISPLLPNGTRSVAQPACVAPLNPANCPFVIIVTWVQPGQNEQHNYTATFNIAGG